VFAVALAAFAFGAWHNARQYLCVMSPSGTVVCGQRSGPAAAAGTGAPLVQPQAVSYQHGRKKVTETRCHKDAEGVELCRTTEYYE
jgi:hypothetical protein